MPAWIHNRAMSLKKDMEKTYGPEKAEQVAFAVATQQAHKLGKSPKKFKSKETGKMERFGTSEGRAEAEAKFDKSKDEYRKTASLDPRMMEAFFEELELIKEAGRAIQAVIPKAKKKSFLSKAKDFYESGRKKGFVVSKPEHRPNLKPGKGYGYGPKEVFG